MDEIPPSLAYPTLSAILNRREKGSGAFVGS